MPSMLDGRVQPWPAVSDDAAVVRRPVGRHILATLRVRRVGRTTAGLCTRDNPLRRSRAWRTTFAASRTVRSDRLGERVGRVADASAEKGESLCCRSPTQGQDSPSMRTTPKSMAVPSLNESPGTGVEVHTCQFRSRTCRRPCPVRSVELEKNTLLSVSA